MVGGGEAREDSCPQLMFSPIRGPVPDRQVVCIVHKALVSGLGGPRAMELSECIEASRQGSGKKPRSGDVIVFKLMDRNLAHGQWAWAR